MATLRAFPGSLVTQQWAEEVSSPAHDAMTGQQRRAHVARHRRTYLRVERTVGDGVTDTAHAEGVLVEGRTALEELVRNGVFARTGPALYLYRLRTADHVQTGIVGELAASDVLEGRVKTHEDVSADKTRHLADHFRVVAAQSSPILLGVRGRGALEAQIAQLSATPPDLHVDSGDGVAQSVWVVDDDADVAALTALVADENLYVVDGHHRVAATRLHAAAHPEDPTAQWTLAVLYPTSELRPHEYNRIVSDLGGRTVGEILDALSGIATVTRSEEHAPAAPGCLAMRLGGDWYRIELPEDPDLDEVARLDPTRVRDEILPVAFGVDPGDPEGRIAHVGPRTSVTDLGEQADRLGGAALILHPLRIEMILAVADAGRHLPPKSTYFAPKPRSGVFLRTPPPA